MQRRTLGGTRHRAARISACGVTVALLLGSLLIGASVSSAAPAAHPSADPIFFYKNLAALQGLRVRPSRIGFNADGNNTVTGLRWRTWGSSVTRAFGTNHVNNCIPNCVSGHISRVRVQVSLSSPGFFRGHHVYRCYRVKPADAFLRQRHCLSG